MTEKELKEIKHRYRDGNRPKYSDVVEAVHARHAIQRLIVYIEKLERLRRSDKETISLLEK